MVGVTFNATPTKIVIKGNPVRVEFKATQADLKPGDLMKMVTSNVEIDIGGAPTGTNGLGIGIGGYESANASVKPATITTAYADNAILPVILVGSGTLLYANVTGVIALGGALTGQAAAGALATGTIGTNHIYAIIARAKTAAAVDLTPVVLL